ncbi:MAG: phytanoyl-CoA dioxygenase family protein [Sumerlaeia bacterium]
MNDALDELYAVSRDHIAAFVRDGHVTTRGILDAEGIAEWEPAFTTLVDRLKRDHGPLAERKSTYQKAFLAAGNLWRQDETARRFVLARRFAGIAADLLGVDRVRLYHDQALFKEPGGGPTPWHQDQHYWPLDTTKTVTMWLALSHAPLEAGALVFASGSHREEALAPMGIGDDSAAHFHRLIRERDFPMKTQDLSAGDATWHAGWTIHKAPSNGCSFIRKAMTVIYYADGARIPATLTEAKELDRAAFLPECLPGDRAAGDLCPLIFDRDDLN